MYEIDQNQETVLVVWKKKMTNYIKNNTLQRCAAAIRGQLTYSIYINQLLLPLVTQDISCKKSDQIL